MTTVAVATMRLLDHHCMIAGESWPAKKSAHRPKDARGHAHVDAHNFAAGLLGDFVLRRR
jgi:hypothetical protein